MRKEEHVGESVTVNEVVFEMGFFFRCCIELMAVYGGLKCQSGPVFNILTEFEAKLELQNVNLTSLKIC